MPLVNIASVLAPLLHLQETELKGGQSCGRCKPGIGDFEWHMDFLCHCTTSSRANQISKSVVVSRQFRRLPANRRVELWSFKKRRKYNRTSRWLGTAV